MFYRFLGKFFLFFYVIPEIVKISKTAAHIAAPQLTKAILEIIEKDDKDLARARATHPAGSRL